MPGEKGQPLPGEWWETRQGSRAYVAALLPDTSPIASSPHSQLIGWLNEHQRVAAGSWSINGEWVTTSPSKQDLVKHFPDCTGWDWQPPDWVELDPVNYGWHVLREGVDQCKNNDGGKFNPAIVNGLAGEKISEWCRQYTFRCLRENLPVKPPEPVKPDPGKGWRLLEPDEKVIQGDEYFEPKGTPRWEASDNWRYRSGEQSPELVYRRRKPTEPVVTPGGPCVAVEVHQKVIAERDALLARMREIEAKAKFYESVM